MLLVGTYTATATYGGDGNYIAAPPAQTTVGVTKATPTLSFTTTPTNPQPGSSFTVKVTVNEPNGGPNPTGTLTWTDHAAVGDRADVCRPRPSTTPAAAHAP